MDRRVVWFAALWLVLILGFLLYAARPTIVGQTVELRLAPVDPTDILRGEYLTLSYQVGRVDTALQDWEFTPGQDVYVRLQEGDGGLWSAKSYEHTRPQEGTYLKGTVGQQGRITFGIEEYFIPEGTGKDVRVDDSWSATVRIDEFGQGRVTGLAKDGEPVTFPTRS